MDPQFYQRIDAELAGITSAGLFKPERVLQSPQSAEVRVEGRPIINLCANNYLGLADDERVVAGAIEATQQWGAGLASVRFICGTQMIHKQLEREIAGYLGYDDAILFAAAFDANGGVFECLLSPEDAIVSDQLNHASIIDALKAAAEATGHVTYRPGTAADTLVQDDGGRVTGVRLSDGETLGASKGVILASGGFAKNPAMLDHYAPHYANAVFVAGAGSQGDGLRMGQALGAELRDMAFVKGTFGKHPTDETNDHSLQAVYKGAIAVNQDGHRFVDESISYKLLGDAVMAQPWHTAYQIMDQGIFDTGDDRVRILDFGRRLEEGLFYVADSLEGLAQQIEIEPGVLKDSVARYNASVDAGRDPEFGRTHLVHHHGALRKIETPPFYAYPSTAVVFGTYCGLRVDSSAKVRRADGSWIEGLYAAGEVTGGFHGAAYMTGSALGKAVVFGKIAGQSAAAA